MSDQGGTSEQAERRGESEEERLDRNWLELIQEVRVVIPGIQFLFAFLLVVPFQQGWVDVSDFERRVYYATLIFTTVSAVFLMAPTARHRLRFRQLDKKWVVDSSSRLAEAGLVFLALATCGVLLLISHVVYDSTAAALATAGVLAMIAWFWFLAPFLREVREED